MKSVAITLKKADGGIKPLSKHTVKVRSSQTGFTLFELLLVLFIMGLAAAVVMSSGSRMQEKSMFNAEARKLYLTVKHAREISIIERMDIVFKVDQEAKKYWIAYGDDKTSETHSVPRSLLLQARMLSSFPRGTVPGEG